MQERKWKNQVYSVLKRRFWKLSVVGSVVLQPSSKEERENVDLRSSKSIIVRIVEGSLFQKMLFRECVMIPE